MNLFLSYAHKNSDLAKALSTLLGKGGQTVWWDDQLRTGPRWQNQLYDQIQRADAIVLALTPAWLESPYCQWEFITAAEQGKTVIPVLLANYPDGSKLIVPNRISQYQWADFSAGFDETQKVQKFLDNILDLAIPLKTEDVAHLNKAAYTNAINQQQQKQINISGGQIGAVENYGTQTNNFGPQVKQTNTSGHNFNVSGSNNTFAGSIDQRRQNIRIDGSIQGGNINFGDQTVHGNLTVNMGGLSAADDSRRRLQSLIDQLNVALSKLPANEQETGEDVAVLAQEVVTEVGKEKPRASMLKIKGENLVQAAKNLLTVAPIAVEIAKILTLIK